MISGIEPMIESRRGLCIAAGTAQGGLGPHRPKDVSGTHWGVWCHRDTEGGQGEDTGRRCIKEMFYRA